MDREKQIEEMASDINDCITEFVTDTGDVYIDDEATAQKMFDKGYRKQSEVVKEIFDEIEKLVSINKKTVGCATYEETIFYIEDFIEDLAELKKKYAGEKEDEQIH